MKIDLLPATKVEGLDITNTRFPNMWNSIQAYNRAIANGFHIESMVLSVNIIKYYLTLVIELFHKQRKINISKTNKILKESNDVKELVDYLYRKEILNKNEFDFLRDYWDRRNKTVHNYINGLITYPEVGLKAQEGFKICKTIFKKAFSISEGTPEIIGGKFRKTITFSPKKL